MKGKLIAKCCGCGLEKGDRDSNDGWFWLVGRTGRRNGVGGRDFCPECSAGLLVRSDEMESGVVVAAGLRLANVADLQELLSSHQHIRVRAAERLFALIGTTSKAAMRRGGGR